MGIWELILLHRRTICQQTSEIIQTARPVNLESRKTGGHENWKEHGDNKDTTPDVNAND